MIEDILENPLAAIAAVATPILGALGVFNPVIGFLATNAGPLFSVGSVLGLTIAPRVEWIPTGVGTAIAITTGLVFIATRLETIVERLTERLS